MEVFLKDISKVSAGNSAPKKDEFSNEGIPFVRAGSLAFLTKYESLNKCEKVSKSTALKKKLKLFKKGSILFAKSGMSSKMGRIYQLEDDAFVVSHLAIIEVDEEKTNPSFIKYFFILKPPFFLIRDDAYPSIKLEDIKNITLNLPDLPTQNKIVALLDKASALVQKREKSIALLDELLRALFLEMFGEANKQFKVWEDVQIKSLAYDRKNSMRSGPFGSYLKHSEFVENGPVAVLGIDNAVKNTFQWKGRRYITNEKYEGLKRYTVFPRDVIITIMGTVGRSAVIPDDIPLAINTKHLACISLDPKKCNPFYLAYSIHSNPYISYQMKAREKGAIMAGLNLTIIKELKLKNAPIELQNQFETIYHNIQAQKETLNLSKTELEHLYNSLLQRAFNGQLNLNVDLELDALLAAIDVTAEKNDIRDIATVYASRLLERIETKTFENQVQYQQAKQVVFQMLQEGTLAQEYDEQTEAVKMKLV